MTQKKTGGPAFPVIPPANEHGHSIEGYPYPDEGMTLRDWFAGQALAGIIASYPAIISNRPKMAEPMYDPDDPGAWNRMKLDDEAREEMEYITPPATLAYQYADAMIEARDK